MFSTSPTFALDLTVATRTGLTGGAGGLGSALSSTTNDDLRYRQERQLHDLDLSRNPQKTHSQHFGHGVMTRWTTWLPSVPLLHRSSPASPNSNACTH